MTLRKFTYYKQFKKTIQNSNFAFINFSLLNSIKSSNKEVQFKEN